jgi:hypothetical protein
MPKAFVAEQGKVSIIRPLAKANKRIMLLAAGALMQEINLHKIATKTRRFDEQKRP